MKRSFAELSTRSYDLLVVGGGIYGAWVAFDAGLRGLSVALVEKGDWASGTSSASSKLIHGGLRYLEHLKFDLVRTALSERRLLSTICPHRVQPLKLAVPLFHGSRMSPFQMRMGLSLYDFLAGTGQPVEPHAFFNRKRFNQSYPFFDKRNIRAGFTYGDCFTDDARLVLELVQGALKTGAVAVNYSRVERFLRNGDHVVGAELSDVETGDTAQVKAAVTVNAAGPWNEDLLASEGKGKYTLHTKGIHLVMPALPTESGFLVMTEQDNRIFFILPWYGKTLLGTTDTSFEGDPDKVQVEEEDIAYLLGEVNRVMPDLAWTSKDIVGAFAGLRSMAAADEKSPSSVSREWSLEEPSPGLLLPVGGKLTSARADAQLVVDRAMALLGKEVGVEHPTETVPLPWSPGGAYVEWKEHIQNQAAEVGIEPETARWGTFRYGTNYTKVLALAGKNPAFGKPLVQGLPFCKAELLYSAQGEMTVRLDDVLRRRIPLVLMSRVDRALVQELADLVAPILGWSLKRKETEITRVVQTWTKNF